LAHPCITFERVYANKARADFQAWQTVPQTVVDGSNTDQPSLGKTALVQNSILCRIFGPGSHGRFNYFFHGLLSFAPVKKTAASVPPPCPHFRGLQAIGFDAAASLARSTECITAHRRALVNSDCEKKKNP
jgi:hypothetical protein